MAFLRRGLVTRSRNQIPSIHTKSDQKIGVVRDVAEVIKQDPHGRKMYFVRYKCQHVGISSSMFQGMCNVCAGLAQANPGIQDFLAEAKVQNLHHRNAISSNERAALEALQAA